MNFITSKVWNPKPYLSVIRILLIYGFQFLGKSPASVGASMGQKMSDPELERLKTKNEQQELKLKQASEYITYQDNQIATLNNSIEEMKTLADASAFKRCVHH